MILLKSQAEQNYQNRIKSYKRELT